MNTLILTNAAIIDGTGADPIPNGSVVVEGDRIKEILPGLPGRIPAGAVAIDCRKQTLLPGLIDAHVHIGAVDANIMEQQRLYHPSMLVIRTLKVIQEALDQGFTTLRDAGGADAGFREAQRQGLIPGPRMFVSGCRPFPDRRPWGFSPPHGKAFSLPGPRPGWRRGSATGWTKSGGGPGNSSAAGLTSSRSWEAGGACLPATKSTPPSTAWKNCGRRFSRRKPSGPTWRPMSIPAAASETACPRGFAPWSTATSWTKAPPRPSRTRGPILVPTLVTYEMISRMGKSLGIPDNNVRKINEARERGLEALAIAHRPGCKIASGSDLLGPMQRYKGMELELKARVLGRDGGDRGHHQDQRELLKKEKDLGTIEAGKLADLILVNGDPLKGHHRCSSSTRKRSRVIVQGGRVYKNIL